MSIEPTQQTAPIAPLLAVERYTQLLKSHDWHYAYSDDHSVYMAGKLAGEKLRQAQRELDPLATIWNSVAPRDCRIAIK